MKSIKILIFALFCNQSLGQITLPSGVNKRAKVYEQIGITDVQIIYNRPAVNGREGHIWGELVHYGFADLHYGTSKTAPWRAGADENTTIEFSTNVSIEGKSISAGKYGFFIAMEAEKATLVFSKYNSAWGSFYYDAKDDALRVEVPVLKVTESKERLTYEFSNQIENAAVINLYWEKVKIPFTVSVDLQKLQIASFRKEFNSGNFYQYWQNMHTAANYCLLNNVNLEEALGWSERSINTFFGETNFKTLITYAGLLEKLGRKLEADSVLTKALTVGKIVDLFQYGYELAKVGKANEAFTVFENIYKKEPTNDYSIFGMALGHYALKNQKLALEFGKKGRDKTNDSKVKNYYSTLITKMEEGKNVF